MKAESIGNLSHAQGATEGYSRTRSSSVTAGAEGHALVIAGLILILCAIDAMLGVRLTAMSAAGLGPATAAMASREAVWLAAGEFALVTFAVAVFVILERRRFLGRIRMLPILYGILIGYAGLVTYGSVLAVSQA